MADITFLGICAVDALGLPVDSYPEPGHVTLFEKLTLTTGGNAVNAGMALGRMGLTASVITKTGGDLLGQFVKDELDSVKIDTRGIRKQQGHHTPFTFVCVHSNGERSFFHTVGTNGTFCLDDIDMGIVASSKVLLVTGMTLMPVLDRQTPELLKRAKAARVTTVLDSSLNANVRDWPGLINPALPYLDYVVPSEREAQLFTGKGEPREMADALAAGGARQVVIKLGENGALVRDQDGAFAEVAAYPVAKVVDTTGAGDTWSAGFCVGLSRGWSLSESARFGNAVAAHCVQAPGAATGIPSYEAVRAFQRQHGG